MTESQQRYQTAHSHRHRAPADLRLPRLVCMSCHYQAMQEASAGCECEDCGRQGDLRGPDEPIPAHAVRA